MRRLACTVLLTLAVAMVTAPGLAAAERPGPSHTRRGGAVYLGPGPGVGRSGPGFVAPHHRYGSPYFAPQPQWVWQPGFWQWNGFSWYWTPSRWVPVFPRY